MATFIGLVFILPAKICMLSFYTLLTNLFFVSSNLLFYIIVITTISSFSSTFKTSRLSARVLTHLIQSDGHDRQNMHIGRGDK